MRCGTLRRFLLGCCLVALPFLVLLPLLLDREELEECREGDPTEGRCSESGGAPEAHRQRDRRVEHAVTE